MRKTCANGRASLPQDDGVPLRARIAAVAERMRATFAELAEVEQMYQRAAYTGAADDSIELLIKDVASKHAANASSLLAMIHRIPENVRPNPDVISDLKMLEFEANELPLVMEGETDVRAGKWQSWEEVRKQLGL